MKKVLLSVFSVSIVGLLVILNFDPIQFQNEEEQLSNILDEAWSEYDVNAYSVLPERSELYVEIDDTENIVDVKEMLQRELEEYNLEEKYSIDLNYSYFQ